MSEQMSEQKIETRLLWFLSIRTILYVICWDTELASRDPFYLQRVMDN